MSADDSEVSFGKPKKRAGRPRPRETPLGGASLSFDDPKPSEDGDSGLDTIQLKPTTHKFSSKSTQSKPSLSFDNPEVRSGLQFTTFALRKSISLYEPQ